MSEKSEENHKTEIGVIFDLDGTILNSTNLVARIPKELAKKYNVSISPSVKKEIEEKILNTLKGRGGKFMVLRLVLYVAKKYRVPWHLRIKYVKDAGILYKKMIKTVPIFPGAQETLEFLVKKNIPIAINTTSSKQEVLDRFKDREEFLTLFNGNIITRTDIRKFKPHPESIHVISQKIKVPVHNLIMIGDMDADIEGGKNAGCITVGVLSGYATKEKMKNYNPDFIIESIKDLPEMFPNILQKIDSSHIRS